jgi:steroid 5-alpha reductase family enzyme
MTPRRWLAATLAGVLVWSTGVFFETVGDHQLRVWAWTRHRSARS